jgi:Transposase DDE domain group 1
VLRDIPASDREALLRVKVTERSALVRVAASRQQLTSHSGLVLVRELASRLGVGGLLERVTVKKRSRGYSPAQAILGLCETLIAGGECLDDVAVLRGDSAQELLRGHGLPEATTLGRFLRRFSFGYIGQLNRAFEELFARVHPLLERETVTLDLDATSIEHHGPVGSRQGTRGTYKARSVGIRSAALSARPASGCTRSSGTVTLPPRPARPVSWTSACDGYPRAPGCFCVPTRASGARTSSPGWSIERSATRSGRR